jgi:hypothetical protein
MEVRIDGQLYSIVPEQVTDKTVMAALDVRLGNTDAGDNITVRDYLRELLLTLWVEQEGFSGKRPFGNSGWQREIYMPLIKAGFIPGKLDGDGYIDEFDEHEGCEYMKQLITAAFHGFTVDRA